MSSLGGRSGGKTLRAKLELEIAIQRHFAEQPDEPLRFWENGAIRTIEPPGRPTPSS